MDGHSSDILDRYWRALNDGRIEEAARLKAEFTAQYQCLLRNFELLDELLDVRETLDEMTRPDLEDSG